MEKAALLPLNDWQIKKTQRAINRFHTFIHGGALLALFYYRITSIAKGSSNNPILPQLVIFLSELTLSFLWLLCQASNWNPIVRTAYPERLALDDCYELPSLDVFICTADPSKEPSLEVMNTVLSAMALDYPPHKLHLYLSDDGGSPVTLRALKEASRFAKLWIPFCRKYMLKNSCPHAFFHTQQQQQQQETSNSHHFLVDKKDIETAYGEFRSCVAKIVAGADVSSSKDHSPIIEVINDGEIDPQIPLLVYVAREKRPSRPHNFKAGALNVLLRVSGMLSNSPYILSLDCDNYCNDTTSARQAMCFHLDPKLSANLAFVQFPQRFHNCIGRNDIYDGVLRLFWPKWEGFNSLRGPILSGSGFVIKREALYGIRKLQPNADLNQRKEYYGSCSEFIKTIYASDQKTDNPRNTNQTLQKELQLLASCSYDNTSKWGEEVGYRYFSVVEDYFTGFNLHCEGWISVYCDPSRPCFLGQSPPSLGETLIQHTRWFLGLSNIALSKYCPLVYGSQRMSILQSMIYAEIAFYALYFLPISILAIVPQLCILSGVPLYPEVSSPFFVVFVFLFLSSQLKHVQEAWETEHPMRTWANEQRIWMMKSLTSYLFAALNAVMEKMGLAKAVFVPTNKVTDEEVEKLHEMGIYNFQAPPVFMVPLCTVYMLNLGSFVVGLVRILQSGKMNEMVMQAFIPLFGIVVNFPLLEGMVLRKDKGRVSPFVSLLSAVISSLVLAYAALFHYY